MAQELMVYSKPQLIVADDQAGLDTGDAYECQVNSARYDAVVSTNSIPSTGCTGPVNSPSNASWTLNITWLEDWTAPGGGLSGWAWTNRLAKKWVRLVPDKDDTAVEGDAQVFVAPGGMGGTFGDGSAGQSTAAWEVIGDPIFVFPPALP